MRRRATLAFDYDHAHVVARRRSGERWAEIDVSRKGSCHPFHIDLTPTGAQALAALSRQTGLTRNDVLAHLVDQHADELTFAEEGVVYAGKARKVATVPLPPKIGRKLRTARRRTRKSYSDLMEALIDRYGPTEAFPAPPVSGKPAAGRSRARAHAR